MTVTQVWFAIWTAICFFSNLFFCKKHKKICLLYLKKKSFFNIEDIYNIIQVLQYKRNLAIQILLLPEHHSAHIPIAWGFLHLAIRRAARYDACCAFSCIVVMLVSRTVCLTYSSFFLWKKSLLLFACSGWIVVTCRLSFSASTDKIFKHSVYCVLPSLYSIIGHILCTSQMYAVSFFHFCIRLLSWDTASSI